MSRRCIIVSNRNNVDGVQLALLRSEQPAHFTARDYYTGEQVAGGKNRILARFETVVDMLQNRPKVAEHFAAYKLTLAKLEDMAKIAKDELTLNIERLENDVCGKGQVMASRFDTNAKGGVATSTGDDV